MNDSADRDRPGFTTLSEEPTKAPPGFSHPGWRRRFPWLVQGTTSRGDLRAPFDLGLFSDASPALGVARNWDALRSSTGFQRVVHSHQVHGPSVRFHGFGPPGLHLADPCDGHATASPGVLLTVTVADCVPVFVVDPGRRVVALLHAGWRGTAAGVLEHGLQMLRERVGSHASDLRVHFGPSICGDCYEVGPEVFDALGLEVPGGPALLDLRVVLARRAVVAGVPAGSVSVSELCTRCSEDALFSHRGGDRERQAAYLGIAL